MRITVIADPVVPVPPRNYGGTERIIDLACRGLVRRGHRIHLVAGPDSRDYGGGLTIHRAPSRALFSRASRKLWFQFLAWRATIGADAIINFGRLDYLEFLYRSRKPIVHWFQNPLTGREVSYVASRRLRRDTFVALSRSQVAGHPAAPTFEIIPNAVDIGAIPFSPSASSPPFLLFLGRLTRNKGVHLAIEAARQAHRRLVIGGNVSNETGGAEYFDTSVKPSLSADCEWVGPYDDATRVKLLAGATALLFPIQWQEPFGIVMIEALASGVPVIALRAASTPEVVVHGETGFLCDSIEEMVAAIHRIKEISREKCRADAELRFGDQQLIDRVEEVLGKAVAS